jgi:hypothetical protein
MRSHLRPRAAVRIRVGAEVCYLLSSGHRRHFINAGKPEVTDGGRVRDYRPGFLGGRRSSRGMMLKNLIAWSIERRKHNMIRIARRPTALASVVVALVSVSPSSAAFQWLRPVMYNCNPPCLEGYTVWRIYAEFNNPGDRLVAVFGNSASPMSIQSGGGNFYQDPDGGNTAPDADVIASAPSAEWDTFCTIGLAKDIAGTDLTGTSPLFPVFINGSSFQSSNAAWFTPNVQPQGAPNAGGRVLIMQLTVPDGGFGPTCSVGIQYRPAGMMSDVVVNNTSPILLGLEVGDVNDDLTVDVNDLLLVIGSWGSKSPGLADPNDDGVVDVNDLLLIISHWGGFGPSC